MFKKILALLPLTMVLPVQAAPRLITIPAAHAAAVTSADGTPALELRYAIRRDPLKNRPLTGTPIRAVLRSPAAGADAPTLDVTELISGMGDFTLRWPHAAPATRDAAPVLELTVDDEEKSPYYFRTPQQVLARGANYLARYSAPEDVARYGYFDVTKAPYGAKGDGVTDNTAAIQRAVNEARDARVVVYFPPGDYLVSDTIQLTMGTIDYGPVPAADWEETWNAREFPCMLQGPVTGPRATIRLKPGTFRDTAAPQPVLYFWSRHNLANITWDPETNKANTNYNHTLNHLDVDLGADNAGAMGISMYAAQGSNLSESHITATGAYTGLAAGTGPGGSIYGVTVDGGRYGAWFNDGQCPVVVNCVFRNQTEHAVYFSGRGTLVLVGIRAEGRGIAIDGDGTNPFNGNLAIVDSVIDLAKPGPAITGRRNVTLSNAWFRHADPLVQLTHFADGTPGPRLPARGDGWTHVRTAAAGVKLVQSPVWKPAAAAVTPNWIDGAHGTEPVFDAVAAEAPPADLTARHAWRPNPNWFDPQVLNAKAAGARGDGLADDRPALQAALDTGRAVFLPKGDYLLSAPLMLRPDSVLFGVNATTAILKPRQRGPNTFADPAQPQPLLIAPGGAPLLANFRLSQPTTALGVYLLDWRAGAGGIVKNVTFDRRRAESATEKGDRMNHPLVRLEGAGTGGRWYGFWNDRSVGRGADSRYMLVRGTVAPLRFYGLNLEHQNGDIGAEFIDTRDVDIFQAKAEGEKTIIQFERSRDFRIFGFGGASSPEPGGANLIVRDCTDFLLAGMTYQQQAARTKADATRFFRVRDEAVGRETVTTPGWEQFVLYQRGQPHQ